MNEQRHVVLRPKARDNIGFLVVMEAIAALCLWGAVATIDLPSRLSGWLLLLLAFGVCPVLFFRFASISADCEWLRYRFFFGVTRRWPVSEFVGIRCSSIECEFLSDRGRLFAVRHRLWGLAELQGFAAASSSDGQLDGIAAAGREGEKRSSVDEHVRPRLRSTIGLTVVLVGLPLFMATLLAGLLSSAGAPLVGAGALIGVPVAAALLLRSRARRSEPS
jgi:hypothetical protein